MMQSHHPKPPRPPPLSVSHQSDDSEPPTRPDPEPKLSSDESPKSPFRYDPKNGAIVAVEKFYSPLTSPLPITPPKDAATPDNLPLPKSSPPHQIIHFNRREDAPPQSGVVYGGGERKGRVGGVRFGPVEDVGRRPSKGDVVVVVEKAALGLRVFEIVFCLISFSVMAADKTQGWSGDSFDRYKEYRFCLTVNILGFLYSAFQAYNLANHLASGKYVITHHLRYQFDFIMDQILAYLLISASSAAASRVDDWQSNWGKDEFTEKASASVSMAFFAFLGFAMSSLISGYNLCNRDLS